jgi:hypothetical protein
VRATRALHDDSRALNDLGRSERLEHEIDFVTQELSRAVGLGGRRLGSIAERARVNASRAIAAVVRKIATEHPALGQHLTATVRTGIFCSYSPDPAVGIEWQVG